MAVLCCGGGCKSGSRALEQSDRQSRPDKQATVRLAAWDGIPTMPDVRLCAALGQSPPVLPYREADLG
jgi:hypothetical protein